MRLIDADALKSYIDCGHLRPPTETCFSELDVVRMLDKQPTIDAEPVVRCKDCWKRWNERECPMCHDEYYYDDDDGGDYATIDYTTDDGFCHCGAKMDGGAEDGHKGNPHM